MSEQIRQIAQGVCDRIASLETPPPPPSSPLAPTFPPVASAQLPSPVGLSSSPVEGSGVPLSVLIDAASDAELQQLLCEASQLRSEADAVVAATAGVVAKRSLRELGYSGLAKRQGDHNAVDMVQRLTGSTRVEAARQVKLGEAMGSADAATYPRSTDADAPGSGTPDADAPDPDTGATGGAADRPVLDVPWHEPLTRAVRTRVLRPEAVTVIMRGLGDPNDRVSTDDLRACAEQLVADAAGTNADELGRRARLLRDQIDPVGVQLRWDQHFDNRKWRFGRTPDGVRTAWIEFDDESGAYIDQLVGTAMRPRRGGPRMIDPVQAEQAQQLRDDPRSNDQLVFDLLMATLKAGAEGDPRSTSSTRQPGVRIVITQEQLDTRDENGHLTGTGFNEDTGEAIPGPIIERHICSNGTRTITVDGNNNPLDVGRDERTFTTKQRIGLAIRDGGCVFEDCTQPPSMTEAHHINEWASQNGLTDIADGILLCRDDHMLIHNNGWKIIREGTKYYSIPPKSVDPDQKPRPLRSRSTLKQPPPQAHTQQQTTEAQPVTADDATARHAEPDDAEAGSPPSPTSEPATTPRPSSAAPAEQAPPSTPPLQQTPDSPPGTAAPAGSSEPPSRDEPTDSSVRHRGPNYRVMETWYVPPENPTAEAS
ncbi:hypothetical protein L1277_001869 [Okibacterium sp. HSC-33S16]|uniref:DUF222 domain-containing protein n=1 Tax=Okibacterium sp. HSC-33S16 TaxID=2910965 RepID=UPI00209E4989|nr:DUF222 domain-containing protein [Okibacterium sp. HSC-33S16]MCP2031771.1 hypothetical protein [Okibacterium sp. HSC-33S16]